MLQHLTRHMNRLEREKEHFGILWIDLDHFKAINDEYGHAMGDHALETTADKIRTDLRLYDYAARWGGDEFLVLIKAPDKETLDQLGQRLCKTLCAVKLTAAENSGPAPDNTRLSVSIGGCFVNQGGSLNGVLAAADQALYMAKNAGRGHYVSTQLHT